MKTHFKFCHRDGTGCLCKLLWPLVVLIVLVSYLFTMDFANDLRKQTADPLLHVYQNECKLKIVTQNLWCHYLVTVGPNSNERISSFVSHVKDFDVVLLQEIFVLRLGVFIFRGWASLIVKEFYKHGFVYHTSLGGSLPLVFGQNGGVAIFSKIPIIDSGHVIFKKSILSYHSDYVNNKGLVWAKVQYAPSKHILFVSTHLSSIKDKMQAHVVRKQEVWTIAEFLKKHAGEPTILTGDFNVCSVNLKSEYEELSRALVPFVDIVTEAKLTTYYNPELKRNETLDLIFCSSDLSSYSTPVAKRWFTNQRQPVSDHFAVATEVALC